MDSLEIIQHRFEVPAILIARNDMAINQQNVQHETSVIDTTMQYLTHASICFVLAALTITPVNINVRIVIAHA